jgi:hypothetical protein
MAEWKLVSFEDGVDTKIATHTAIASAHHAKYTDAEAVAAVLAGDDYLKNDAEDEGYVNLTLDQPTGINTSEKGFKITRGAGYCIIGNGTGSTTLFFPFFVGKPIGDNPGLRMRGLEAVGGGSYACMGLQAANEVGSGAVADNVQAVEILNWSTQLCSWTGDGTMDIKNHKLKNPKNHAASALSGTKKLVEIDIGGTSYYFEVYPTKA